MFFNLSRAINASLNENTVGVKSLRKTQHHHKGNAVIQVLIFFYCVEGCGGGYFGTCFYSTKVNFICLVYDNALNISGKI